MKIEGFQKNFIFLPLLDPSIQTEDCNSHYWYLFLLSSIQFRFFLMHPKHQFYFNFFLYSNFPYWALNSHDTLQPHSPTDCSLIIDYWSDFFLKENSLIHRESQGEDCCSWFYCQGCFGDLSGLGLSMLPGYYGRA